MKESENDATTKTENKRRPKEQEIAGAVAVRQGKDTTAVPRHHEHGRRKKKKGKERERGIKIETTKIRTDTEGVKNTEDERESGKGRGVTQVVGEERKGRKSRALRRGPRK